jgi:hypothetical protein
LLLLVVQGAVVMVQVAVLEVFSKQLDFKLRQDLLLL